MSEQAKQGWTVSDDFAGRRVYHDGVEVAIACNTTYGKTLVRNAQEAHAFRLMVEHLPAIRNALGKCACSPHCDSPQCVANWEAITAIDEVDAEQRTKGGA